MKRALAILHVCGGLPLILSCHLLSESCLAGEGALPWEGEVQTVVSNDFETGLPGGWSVIVNADTNIYWRFDDPGQSGNLTGGSGAFAEINSYYYGDYADADAELRTPAYAVMNTALTYLVFRTDFKYYEMPPGEVADVDVSTNGGSWHNVWRQTGVSYQGPVRLDLTSGLRGASNYVVRFHYYQSNFDWWWQVDDVTVMVEGDANTNGLPDWWETRYYGGRTNLVMSSDSDQDGAPDYDEFIAGTDPTNSASVLLLGIIRRANDQRNVEFQTVSGRVYALEFSTNLLQAGWTDMSPQIIGMGGTTNLTLGEEEAGAFYRLNTRRW